MVVIVIVIVSWNVITIISNSGVCDFDAAHD